MDNCPFCGKSLSTDEQYCCRCKNDTRIPEKSLTGFSGYFATLKKLYSKVFEGNASTTIIEDSDIKNLESLLAVCTNSTEIAEVRLIEANTWVNYLLKWGVQFDENGNITDTKAAENKDIFHSIDEASNNTRLNKKQKITVKQIRDRIGHTGYTLRAQSLIDGCREWANIADYDTNIPPVAEENLKTIKKHLKNRQRPLIFISAPTLDSLENETKEYLVAKELKRQLDLKGIRSFWWENFNTTESDICNDKQDEYGGPLLIAAKIAFGLAYSSIFVGLAFDFDNYSENQNCKYEFTRFTSIDKFSNQGLDDFVDSVSSDTDEQAVKLVKKYGKFLKKFLPDNSSRNQILYTGKTYDSLAKYKDNPIHTWMSGKANKIITYNNSDSIDSCVTELLKRIFVLIKSSYKEEYNRLRKNSHFTSDDDIYREFYTLIKKTAAKRTSAVIGADELFVSDSSTPSDYFFKYSVIDSATGKSVAFSDEKKNGWNEKDNKFIFFIEQYYKAGSRKFRLNLVVRDWNQAFMENGALRAEAIGVPNITDKPNSSLFTNETTELSKYKKFRFEGISAHSGTYEYNVNYTHSHDTGSEGSCCALVIDDVDSEIIMDQQGKLFGSIIFYDLRNDLSDDVKSNSASTKEFRFALVLRRRIYARYAKEKVIGNNIIFRFDPAIPNDLDVRDLHIFREQKDYIPCLKNSYEVPNAKYVIKKNRKQLTVKVAIETGDDFEYRLSSGEDSRYLLLYDYGILQNKDTKLSNQGKSKTEGSDFPLKCPYCANGLFKPKGKDKKTFKTGVIFCTGQTVKSNSSEAMHRIICKNHSSLSNDNKLVLPEAFEVSNSVIVHMLGGKDAGKSVFISRLFEFEATERVIETRMVGECIRSGDKDNLSYHYSSVEPRMSFVQDTPLFDEVRFHKPEVFDGTSFSSVPFETRFLKHQKDKEGLDYVLYSGKKYSNFIHPTQGEEKVSDIPFLFSIKNRHLKKSYVSIFDIPGESALRIINDPTNAERNAISGAESLILLCNGLSAKQDVGVDNNIDDAIAQLKAYINRFRNERTLNTVNLAIVLCKFDAFEDDFLHDSTIRSLSPMGKILDYKNSEYRRYINLCSEEIESYMYKGQGHGQELIELAKKFKHHKFFAVSSIGHRQSVLHEDGGSRESYLRFVASPRGIEHVLTWIAFRTGII